MQGGLEILKRTLVAWDVSQEKKLDCKDNFGDTRSILKGLGKEKKMKKKLGLDGDIQVCQRLLFYVNMKDINIKRALIYENFY